MPKMNNCSGEYLPVDEFAQHPILQQINWTERSLIAMIRNETMAGYYDTSLKSWMTTKEEVKEALKWRNDSFERRRVNLDDF